MRAVGAEKQRVAVRGRACDVQRRERAVSAGLVLDDDILVECRAEWLRDDAATVSVALPGPNGTIMVIDLLG